MIHFKYFIATAALSALLSLQALAATASISFSDPSVTVGSEVNVTMKVSSTDGTLSRSDITLGYDTNLLQFVSGTDAEGGAGTIRVKGATNGAGTGTLEYNLKFNTLSSGSAAIKLANYEVYDTDEAIAEVTHQGSSTVTVSSSSTSSNNALLSSLLVSPGTLTPEFSSTVTEYSVIVGTDVNTLAINASTEDSGASTSVSGNENLNMGENTVSVTVTAADGMTQAQYTIKVNKQEGGPSAGDAQAANTQTVNEGVKLSSKEKTITIMNPGTDVEIPAGFAESTIDIDGHQVKGWVWKEDTEHQYCIVYGMNDAGELNFYRYDLSEKTIQRYFEDPVEVDTKKNAEKYPEVVERYDKLVGQYNSMFVLACVLGGLVLLLFIFVIVLLTQRRGSSHTDLLRRSDSQDPKSGVPEASPSEKLDETIALDTLMRKDNLNTEDLVNPELEMTRVITKKSVQNKDDSSLAEKRIAQETGLDLEDLDSDDSDVTTADEDLGATKAFDLNNEWKTASSLNRFASSNVQAADETVSAEEDTAESNGLDIEDL
ncbi:cadherin-like beta sandwich domain-containing protein [Oribacterium sp. P6A1]|uniref:cadherin-like beta sandwich domain-containing protein n=1 Tax=Oribacterium sp. P6A1 TaxID=1410612 RepID=UPI00068F47FB|nr:cadherin-like beta sandwich domain-containing protein [Oribacterium sp. P6A1]